MIVLGMHFGHDGAVAIVKDGKLIGALALERLTRKKKDMGVTPYLLDAVFSSFGIKFEDVDAIALSDFHPGFLKGSLDFVESKQTGFDAPCTWGHPELIEGNVLEFFAGLRGRKIPAYNIGHQVAHCASAFYTSPFDTAACFSMDASSGDIRNNSVLMVGDGVDLKRLRCPGAMFGFVYGRITERLGLGPQIHKAGSMMGLASYGQPIDRVMNEADSIVDESFFDLSTGMDYYNWTDVLWGKLYGFPQQISPEFSDSTIAMDIAATVQALFERAILKAVDMLPDVPNLCLSGGSFLNCNANSAVSTLSKFKNVHLFPAAGDDGQAVGAALYVAHQLLREPRAKYRPEEIAYLGPDRPSDVLDVSRVVDALVAGKVVGLFQGRSEFGPRALGNRSILADPRRGYFREFINTRVKRREWFRPLAPAVMAEHVSDFFEFEGESPFMLLTSKVKKRGQIPAVEHVDGSARMQTVTPTSNPNFYAILKEFRDRTGCPVLLNTSLNGPDEPILELVEHADKYRDSGSIGLMAIDGRIYEKCTH